MVVLYIYRAGVDMKCYKKNGKTSQVKRISKFNLLLKEMTKTW